MVGVMEFNYNEYMELAQRGKFVAEGLSYESLQENLDRRAARLQAAQQVQMLTSEQPIKQIKFPEGAIMAPSNVDQKIKQEMEKRRVEREVARRLDLVDSYGVDNYDPGTVITFEKKFPSSTKVYTYAVIKATEGDKWFSTGHDCVAGTTLTWDGLVELLVTGEFPVTSVVVKGAGGTQLPAPKEETK